MQIFKDILNGDVLASTTAPVKLVDGFLYEFETRYMLKTNDGRFIPEDESTDDDEGQLNLDFVLKHNLQLVHFDLHECYEKERIETLNGFIGHYLRKVKYDMRAKHRSEEDMNEYMKKTSKWSSDWHTDARIKKLQFFVARYDGSVVVVEEREVNGKETYVVMLPKEAVVVSTE